MHAPVSIAKSASRSGDPTHPTLLTLAALTLLSVPAAAQAQFAELPRKELPVGPTCQTVALGDVDGDGDLDIVLGSAGQDRLQLNDGYGAFHDVTAAQMPVGGGAVSIALGDLDGDGDLEILSGTGGQNRLYENDGTGRFVDVTTSRMPIDTGRTGAIELGDLDGDLDLDMLLLIQGQPACYVNDGTGRFADGTATRLPPLNASHEDAALGDVDGDGDLDAILASDSGYVLLRNDGSGSFIDASSGNMPAGWSTLSLLGDVDGDGDLDLIGNRVDVHNYNGADLFDNDGAGRFTRVLGPYTGLAPADDAKLADIDGDGDLDLLSLSFGFGSYGEIYNQKHLALNDGSGVFTLATNRLSNMRPDPIAIALGDLERDGDLDIVVVGAGSPSMRLPARNTIECNLRRQLHAPDPLQIGAAHTLQAYLRYGATAGPDFAGIWVAAAPAAIPLGSLGVLGIDPATAFPVTVLPIQSSGDASFSLVVPNDASLAGTPLFWQAALLDGSIARLSNVVADAVVQ